jgi:hypothetical protein
VSAGEDGGSDAHLNQKLHVAIAIEDTAAPGACADVLQPSSARRCDGREANVRFDSIAQDHDGAYLPGSLPLSGFGVDGKNYGARISALD